MVVADVDLSDVQTVVRRLGAGRVGFEARRTMSSDSGPYDAVVIGGGAFTRMKLPFRSEG